VKLTWGYDQKRHVEDMDLEEQQHLLDWIDSQDEIHPSKQKEMKRVRARLMRLIGAEEQAETEDQDFERGRNGPQSIVTRLSGAALKVFLTLVMLRLEYGRDPVRATGAQLAKLSGVSERQIITVKNELLDALLIREATQSEYVVLTDCEKTAELYPFFSSLFLLKDFKKVLYGRSSAIISSREKDDLVDEVAKILDPEHPLIDTARRIARGHVNLLAEKGRTAEDVLQVARWARRMYTTGEERFSPLLNVCFITELKRFGGYLAAARAGPARKEYHVGGHLDQDNPDVKRWNAAFDARVKAIKDKGGRH
jgi:hypothetical protein